MKKLNNITSGMVKITGIIAFSLSSFFVNAGTGNGVAAETGKIIKQNVKFTNPVQKSEKVEVLFTTAQNGKVDFVLAKTENKEIKSQLEKQFMGLMLDKLEANVAYSIVFNFKTI
jgi:hypothetical protein